MTEENVPPRPDPIALELRKIGGITSIEIKYLHTGDKPPETFVTLKGRCGQCEGYWRTYRPYLKVEVDYCTVASLHECFIKQIKAWREYEKKHAKKHEKKHAEELAEYERLKAKFEGMEK